MKTALPTAADFYALDPLVDYSTTVFVFTATINFVDGGRYTTLNLTSGGTTVGLYMSGAGDYSWLEDFYGQEVEMEIAACNWNNKTYWRGCILAIRKATARRCSTRQTLTSSKKRKKEKSTQQCVGFFYSKSVDSL